jgi:hypothetical protein
MIDNESAPMKDRLGAHDRFSGLGMGLAPYVIMHVPKCAGLALAQSLARAIGAETVAQGFDRTLFGRFADFASMSEEVRGKIHLHGLPPARPGELIHGHYALSSLVAAYPGAHLVTVMREPRCRLISHFLFWRGHSDSDMAGWGGWMDRMRLAHGRLEDFLENRSLAAQLDNLFTRFLLSPHPDIPEDSFIAPRHHDRLHDQALAKLRHFGLVDVVENAALERNVARWLGREFHMDAANVTSLRSDLPVDLFDQLTGRAVERLQSHSAIDRRLWVHAARQADAFPEPEVLAESMFAAYLARQTANFASSAAPPRYGSPPSPMLGYAASL